MDDVEKKRQKALAKAAKKQAKAEKKRLKALAKAAGQATQPTLHKATVEHRHDEPSAAVRFAETVRGVLFLILSVSMMIAAVLSNKGYIVKLEDIVDSLLLVWIGRVGIAVIAAAFFIYGLKSLRAIK